MKPRPIFLALLLTLCTSLMGAEPLTFTTNSGKELKGVTPSLFLGDSVVFSHVNGEQEVLYTDLSEAIQEQLEISIYALPPNAPAALKLIRIKTDTALKAATNDAERNAALKVYAEELATLKGQMTEAGQILEALSVAAEERRLEGQVKRQLLAQSKKLEGQPLWLYSFSAVQVDTGQVLVTPQVEGWLVEKGPKLNAALPSAQSFTPPFKIVAELRPTAVSEVRFVYDGKFIARFYSNSRQQLNLYRPGTSSLQFNGKGALQTDAFQQCELHVHNDSLRAYVDGELRGELKADFTGLNAPVAISPFRDCPVVIKSFGVWPLSD